MRVSPEGARVLGEAMDAWEAVPDELEAALGAEQLEHLIETSWAAVRTLKATDESSG